MRSVTSERGQRIEGEPQLGPRERRPRGTNVVREMGDRTILRQGDQVFVESNERPRMRRDAREIYYENLPNGRVRETVVRGDGTRVVTIRNDYGDIIRRSRITPDGREYVLVYVDEHDYGRVDDWRDPGLDLPPMRLDIPCDEYILDAGRVDDPDDYYTFLERPPVERVERLYSVDEVKRSARIRDKTPRVELDTVTFEFGSAGDRRKRDPRLRASPTPWQRLLKKNPAETFLIEGHTDAVGSGCRQSGAVRPARRGGRRGAHQRLRHPAGEPGDAGLWRALPEDQDRRAGTQNRRVAVRRITPLVAPVAANE